MEVTATFLADLAKADTAGKVNAIGIFNHVVADEFPTKIPEVAFILMLDVLGDDLTVEHLLTITISLNGSEEEQFIENVPMEFGQPENGMPLVVGQMIARIGGFGIPEDGVYVFNIYIDGDHKYRTSFRALKRRNATDAIST